MNFVDKGLSVDNGCFRYQSLFLRWISDSSSRPQTVTRKHLRDSMCNEKGKAIKEDSPLVRS